MCCINKKFKSFINNVKGVAYIEFALALPLLLLFVAGGIELTRYLQANQKVDTASTQIANFITQQKDPNLLNYDKIRDNVFQNLLDPFPAKNASFIVSGVSSAANPGELIIDWQEARGHNVQSSKIGGSGGAPIPVINNLDLRKSESLVVVEVFYGYENIIPSIDAFTDGGVLNFSGDAPLYQRSVMRYRESSLEPQKGNLQIAFKPSCCGRYCDGDFLPTCACAPGGGGTADPDIAAAHPTCRLVATCANGGITDPAICNPPPDPCKKAGAYAEDPSCNPTCANGGITDPAICKPECTKNPFTHRIYCYGDGSGYDATFDTVYKPNAPGCLPLCPINTPGDAITSKPGKPSGGVTSPGPSELNNKIPENSLLDILGLKNP